MLQCKETIMFEKTLREAISQRERKDDLRPLFFIKDQPEIELLITEMDAFSDECTKTYNMLMESHKKMPKIHWEKMYEVMINKNFISKDETKYSFIIENGVMFINEKRERKQNL